MSPSVSQYTWMLDLRDRIPTFPRPYLRNYTTEEKRNEHRELKLPLMEQLITDKLASVWDEAHPHFHEMHLMHPYPWESRQLARLSFKVRIFGWRGAEWMATLKGLDFSDEQQWLWGQEFMERQFLKFDEAWDTSHQFRVPAGIPETPPTLEQHEQWQPDTTLWDMDDAGQHELDLHGGGRLFFMLYDFFGDSDSRKAHIKKEQKRVSLYWDYWYNGRKVVGLPLDPYDPDNWGHNAKLRAVEIDDSNTGDPINLTPEFDPEIFEYTTPDDLTALSASLHFQDPFLKHSTHLTVTPNPDSIAYTVTAYDGVTQLTYTIRHVSGD